MSARSNAPVIIKRKKVIQGGGHHGGAWKVAYADFVTAMMAFFMLMWLLNATTEKQRKGIADYFNPTIPINRISGGGEGSFGGTNIFAEQVLAQNGTGASVDNPSVARQARGDSGTDASDTANGESGRANDRALAEIEEILSGHSGESMVSEEILRHIVTRVTDEGLIVELFDTTEASLFQPGGAEPTLLAQALAAVLAELFGFVTNGIAVTGHLSARPVVVAGADPWELSTDRADEFRRLLEGSGLNPAQVRRVTGHADRLPVTRDPMALRNNRIEVVLLRAGR